MHLIRAPKRASYSSPFRASEFDVSGQMAYIEAAVLRQIALAFLLGHPALAPSSGIASPVGTSSFSSCLQHFVDH
jgi:hypothetical protein